MRELSIVLAIVVLFVVAPVHVAESMDRINYVADVNQSPADDRESATSSDPGDALWIEDQCRLKDNELSQHLAEYSSDELDQMTHDKDVRVAACAVEKTASVTAHGTTTWLELTRIAGNITATADDALIRQEMVRQRSPFVRFFIGGDREASAALERDAAEYQAQTARLQGLMTASNFNQGARSVLQRHLVLLGEESNRLARLAEGERRDQGIFGGIAGIFLSGGD